MVFETHGVVVHEIRALRNHNLYAYMPVLRIEMEIGTYDERASNEFPGLIERLVAWLPGLKEHACSVGRPGGFLERLRRGTYLPHICEHVALELQNKMGFDVGFGRARGTGTPGRYRVVMAYKEAEPAKAAFEVALRGTLAAMHNEPFDYQAAVERLMEIADDFRLGPSTGAVVAAARRKHIPVLRLLPTGSLVQLGYGVHQKRIIASETSRTSAIAVELCQEKPLTNHMLRAVGVPVPEGQQVKDADEAWTVAQDIGLPVVVKPEDGNQGKGVTVNLRDEAHVQAAYALASKYGRVLVERHVQGADYRLLVVNGEMVAAARRDPAHVVGDGMHTIQELVAAVNKDPRRRPGHASELTQLTLDGSADLVLQQQDLTRTSIPEAGRKVRLRTNANLSTGGTATDVTDEVHPKNARLAELAAQILALDVAGIDVICEDIRRPLDDQPGGGSGGGGGAIVEVNAAPGLRMHLSPTVGTPRDVGKPIVDMLYPGDADGRIPIIAVTGTNGKTTVTRLIAHMFQTAKKVVGMTSTEGTYIGKDRILAGDCSGPRSAEAVLLHPRVEVAVLETARGGILREGLAFDGCSVGVVLNVTSDHLGIAGINTLEELARVKQVVVEAVRDDGHCVLNADDPLVAEMAAACKGKAIYFGMNTRNPVLAAHRTDGGMCVYAEDGALVLEADGTKTALVDFDRLEFTAKGRIGFQVANALAATAAALAAGLNPAMIVRALTTFRTDATTVPGRFNIFDINNVQVVLDYGHNTKAIEALVQAVAALGDRRTVVVLGLPGDRRDEDLAATAAAAGGLGDSFVLHDLGDRRGRAADEVPRLLQRALPHGKPSEIAVDQATGLRRAWEQARPGERIVVIADIVDETLALIHALAHRSGEDEHCEHPLSEEMAAKP
jgi:cyanophycin synthetase